MLIFRMIKCTKKGTKFGLNTHPVLKTVEKLNNEFRFRRDLLGKTI